VSLTAVEAVPEKKPYISTAKRIPHQQPKISLMIFRERYKFSNRNISLLKAVPWTIKKN